MKQPNQTMMNAYLTNLAENERADATVRKYRADLTAFLAVAGNRPITKQTVLDYKKRLSERYAAASVNAALAALNGFFAFCERPDLRVRNLRVQRAIFEESDRELTKAEYLRLLRAAERNERLCLLLQTIASTGLRVSELRFITAEAAARGFADVANKGKRRRVWIPRELCRMLHVYSVRKGVRKGPIFVTRYGNPIDRSNIWGDLKKLCRAAKVHEKKVFPHNLRHLFARTYYSARHDIVRLADLLGHSSVNTTRIYTMESGSVHRRQIQDLGLLQPPAAQRESTT